MRKAQAEFALAFRLPVGTVRLEAEPPPADAPDGAHGNFAGARLPGEQAAVQFGIREQSALQGMWNDPVRKLAAKGMRILGSIGHDRPHTDR